MLLITSKTTEVQEVQKKDFIITMASTTTHTLHQFHHIKEREEVPII